MTTFIRNLLIYGLILLPAGVSAANLNPAQIKASAENEVRSLIDPILKKYCQEQCKVLSIDAAVDLATPEETAPGFDDTLNRGQVQLAASSVRVRMLIDEMVGPISRQKIFDLIQEYIDVLDYPVTIETKVTRFPQPVNSSTKVTELRNSIGKKFSQTLEGIFNQFCPDQCLLGNLEVKVEPVNAEEAQYGNSSEFIQDGDTVIRIKKINASILFDETLTPAERSNITEMAALKSNAYKNVEIDTKVMKFPHPLAYRGYGNSRGGMGIEGYRDLSSTNSKSSLNAESSSTSTSAENNISRSNSTESHNSDATRQERFEKFEKIERVENGDAVHKELLEVKKWGGIFAGSILLLLVFLAISVWLPRSRLAIFQPAIQKLFPNMALGQDSHGGIGPTKEGNSKDRAGNILKKYEIERLTEELTGIFAEQPRVAKQVFSRILKEEGVETTAQYIAIFGEGIVIDMLRDPSLQRDVNELMEFYAKNQFELSDDDRLELLRQLHNRTVSAKLMVVGNRSSNLFDFLIEMDGMQILELVKNESLTVKAIIITQCDPQKQASIFAQLDEMTRMKLMTELSRIDHLPRDYIYNVANALKRKRQENPRLNTEALPGSEVLVSLMERTSVDTQRQVMQQLEQSSPESARTVKGKIVSLDTLNFLRDNHLLEIVLNLKHDELIQFLKSAPQHIRNTIFAKSPKDLVAELEEELAQVTQFSREAFNNVERKIINRIKLMANDGLINLVEVNERLFNNVHSAGVEMIRQDAPSDVKETTKTNLKKVAGW